MSTDFLPIFGFLYKFRIAFCFSLRKKLLTFPCVLTTNYKNDIMRLKQHQRRCAMFKNTRESIDAIIHDFRLLSFLVTVISNLVCIGYFTYASVVGTGILPINIATVAISLIYIIIYGVTYGKKGTEKRVKSIATKINSGVKLIFRTVTLAATVYGIFIAESTNGITIILATLSILMWIISFVIEVAKYYVEIRFNRLKESLLADIAPVVAVAETVSNVYQNVKEEVDEIISEGKETVMHGYETVKSGVQFVTHGVNLVGKTKGLFSKISATGLFKRSPKVKDKKEQKKLSSPEEKETIVK